ncbi:hypothetical protein [Algoriphagus sp. CAU 1675]|uniref:hypothetical protein n=1 Tax=Algoriphagus sp. CAU 1675 TaxID=3032597 RepID=UPI0023DB1B1A|nr:hypothetical protein [Algoriphagus sp. CAU 1675]MDF2159371.1 hypothetical protein [Algoriphagus sp. CAU 1675]
MPQQLLFISWDSDSSNYLENLFFPILKGLQDRGLIQAYVFQCSWASEEEVARIRSLAKDQGIVYFHQQVSKKPNALFGAYRTVKQARKRIKALCLENDIKVLMPRSTMPAWIVNGLNGFLKKQEIRVVFDADGLPIQERVDFGGLKKGGILYRLLTEIERKALIRADHIITRSEKSIEWHRKNNPSLGMEKFTVVCNGRDPDFFDFQIESRNQIRKQLGLREKDVLLVHSGSLGESYAPKAIQELIQNFLKEELPVYLLILSRNSKYASSLFPEESMERVFIHEVDFNEIPKWLSAGDVGFSLRTQAPSLCGLSPIKLGEYFMMNLPVILSPGIGDMDDQLQSKDFCFFYRDFRDFQDLKKWLSGLSERKSSPRKYAMDNFSLEKSLDYYQLSLGNL